MNSLDIRVFLVGLWKPFPVIRFAMPVEDLPSFLSSGYLSAQDICRFACLETAGKSMEARPGDIVEWSGWEEDQKGRKLPKYAVITMGGGIEVPTHEAREILMIEPGKSDGHPTFSGLEAFRLLARNGFDPLSSLDTKNRYLAAIYLLHVLRDRNAIVKWCKDNGIDFVEMEKLRQEFQRIINLIERK